MGHNSHGSTPCGAYVPTVQVVFTEIVYIKYRVKLQYRKFYSYVMLFLFFNATNLDQWNSQFERDRSDISGMSFVQLDGCHPSGSLVSCTD